MAAINEHQGSEALRKSLYGNWRRSDIPEFHFRPLFVDLRGIPSPHWGVVEEICLQKYQDSNFSFDQSIADAALAFVRENGDPASHEPGPLLKLSRELSKRYLDLFEAHAQWEFVHRIPMISVEAGQLKNHGFNTHEIIQMKKSCEELQRILSPLKEKMGRKQFLNFFACLTDSSERRKLLQNQSLDSELRDLIQNYEKLDESKMIDRARFMMIRYGSRSIEDVDSQLSAIANMRIYREDIQPDERLLMEIRHRVAGDEMNSSPFWLGTNPLSYLNIIKNGDPHHLEAEFRNRLFFVYSCNHFTNLFMTNPEVIEFTNEWLQTHRKGWRIDPEFVQTMNKREPKWLPPLFRYGSYAALNVLIRDHVFDATFYERYASPHLEAMDEERVHPNGLFRHRLSPRELFAQVGDYRNISIKQTGKKLGWGSGGACFRIKELDEIDDSPAGRAAKAYISMTQQLLIPTYTAISGTFDQMATMGGFVGITLSQKELRVLRLAMIAFMVSGRDHSVHEIMQSSKSFGLEYEPGPGFERSIAPDFSDRFLSLLRREQDKRGCELPSTYLTAEFANTIYKELTRKW